MATATKKKVRGYFDRIDRKPLVTGDDSYVQQSFKDSCDVNKIVARHYKDGTLKEFLAHRAEMAGGQYLDVSDVATYQEAQEIVIKARETFEALPAKVRERFNHDATRFLAFCENPENRDEMQILGLLKKQPDVVAPKGEQGSPIGEKSTPPPKAEGAGKA